MRHLSFAALILFSCTTEWKEKHHPIAINYFDQSDPADSAELLGWGILSSDSAEHSPPAFTPDGKTVLWSIVSLPSYASRIWQSDYVDGKWSPPRTPSFSDTTASESSPCFSIDGNRIVFSSGRRLPSGYFPSKGNALWEVLRTGQGWSLPRPLDTLKFETGNYAPALSASGNVYFTHGPFRSPDWNIRVAHPAKSDGAAVLLASSINSGGYEDGPCIAPDESFIIFESDRPGGVGGSIDLYIAFKSASNGWTQPQNMGSKINTAASERFARVSPDGKFLFFGSNRRIVNGNPNFDLYWISASAIEDLKAIK